MIDKGEATWTIAVDDLLNKLDVLEMVPPRFGLPSSEFYKIENLGGGKTRWAISSEATGVIRIQGNGEWPHPTFFYLDRRMMIPFVMAARNIRSTTPFQFQFQGKQLIIRQGRRKAQFLATSIVEGYSGGSVGKLLDKMVVSEHVKSLIYCARNCGTTDSLNPQMNCVYVLPTRAGVDILATNETIMYRARAKVKVVQEPVPFPIFLVSLLGSGGLKAIEWRKDLVALRYPSGEIWQSVSSKAQKGFPKDSIEQYISEGSKKELLFRVSSRKFSRIVSRMAMYVSSVRRADWVLEVKGFKDKNKILLESRIANTTFKEALTVDGTLPESFMISWPLEMLLPIFEFIEKKNKEVPLEVRLWESHSRKKSVLASYIKTGDIELIVPSRKV